jgi:hypothetical protein
MNHVPRTLWTFIISSIALGAAALAACSFPKPADVPECRTASDCTSPSAPFCAAGSCVAACQANADCASLAATPFCQTTSGKCVACLDASVCSADKPVCDTSLNVCRGCDRDDQCPSGVCVDAQGRCAMASEVVFVSPVGSDNATCAAAAPCATFTAAFAATTEQRYIIHIVGGTYRMTTGVAPSGGQFVIDGSDTVIFNDHGVTISATQPGQTITLSRVTINASEGTAISASNDGAVLLYDVTLGATAVATGGSLSILNSTVQEVRCLSAGVLDIEHSTTGFISSDSCGLTLLSSRLNNELEAMGGKIIVENNLITSQNEQQDGVLIRSSVSGSRFAFNTLVNFSGIDDTADVMGCNPGLDVSSNIFAWHSSADLAIDGCVPHDSLFDALIPAALVGTNHQADAATFFVDLNGKDLHLAPGSPARGIGESGIVDVDIDGRTRPTRPGSRPDAGAYEAP